MSVDKRRLDHDAEPGFGDDPSLDPLASDDTGLLGAFKRYFETWSRLFVEQQVAAKTGRHR